VTKRLNSPTGLTSFIKNGEGPLAGYDAAASQHKQTKKRTSIWPAALLVWAFCFLFVGSISALPQAGGVKMWPQKNRNVEPHNPRIRRRQEEKRRSANPTSNVSSNTNPGPATADRGPVTSKPRPRGAPVLLILGGMFVGFLALAGTVIAGIVIVKSVREKRT